MPCRLCHEDWIETHITCSSCGESFCADHYQLHFTWGPHRVIRRGYWTEWTMGYEPQWPRKLMGPHTYMEDGTGRKVWIPSVEPLEWDKEQI